MIVERLERRVLGALRPVDAVTTRPIRSPLDVTAEGVRWLRNRSGLYVVRDAPGLGEHTRSFSAPPTTPAVGSVTIDVRVDDPKGRYLSRRTSLRLPRRADPAGRDAVDSLFRPVDTTVFPAPTAPLRPGWSVVRASVTHPSEDRGLPGALVRVVRVRDDALIGSAMTDGRGEALVAVQGIPVTAFNTDSGPVLETEVAARLEVVWDPADPTRHRWPDPDDLEARRTSLLVTTLDVQLASGRHAAVTL